MANMNLFEAKRFMTERERKLRTALVNLLKKKRHAKYAERLSKFDVNIVPLSEDPMFTAGIVFDTGIIYIGEGFLTDPAMFEQLDVIMRHELAHNLLMHEIRMINHLGKNAYRAFEGSQSLHDILNVIMDDEISNKKYSAADKEIVRNMFLNGRLIGGLVTEDHRADWMELSLEQMYEKVKAELDTAHNRLRAGLNYNVSDPQGRPDQVKVRLAKAFPYVDTQSASFIPGSIDDFVAKGCTVRTPRGRAAIAEPYKKIVEAIYNSFKENMPDGNEIETLIDTVSRMHPTAIEGLLNPVTGELMVELTSPESKSIAMDVLKKYRSDYLAWYNKVKQVLARSGYDAEDTKKIFRGINQGGAKNAAEED